MNLNQLFDMGGYGAYVWSTYGITFFVLTINLILSLQEKRSVKKIIKRYLKSQ